MSDSVTKYYESMSDREIMNAKRGISMGSKETISEEDRKDAYKILAYYNEASIKLANKILDESKNMV